MRIVKIGISGVIICVSVFCTVLMADEYIIPTPQKVEYSEDFIMLGTKEGSARTCIAVPEKIPKAIEYGLERLQARIVSLGGKRLSVIKDNENSSSYAVRIVLASVGQGKLASEIVSRKGYNIDKKYPGPQGYIIKVSETTKQKTILCMGSDPRGAYYAIESLIQLIALRENNVRLRVVDIEDWPDFKLRIIPYGAYKGLDYVKRLASYKLNVCGFHYGVLAYVGGGYKNPNANYVQDVRSACEFASRTDAADIIQYINPYFKGITLTDPADVDNLIEAFELSLGSGGKYVMLCADDYFRIEDKDKERFATPFAAQSYLATTVHKRLKNEYPDFTMLFCPHPYIGYKEKNIKWYADLAKNTPPEVGLVWTGHSVRSHKISVGILERFHRLVGRKPFYWDNTIYDYHLNKDYPHGILTYIYNPYILDNEYPPNFYEYLDRSGVHVNGMANENFFISFMTVADYLWNPKAYDPRSSLCNALVRYAGKEGGKLFYDFRRLILQIYGSLGLLLESSDNRIPTKLNRDLTEIIPELIEVKKRLNLIKAARPLLKELYLREAGGPEGWNDNPYVKDVNVGLSKDEPSKSAKRIAKRLNNLIDKEQIVQRTFRTLTVSDPDCQIWTWLGPYKAGLLKIGGREFVNLSLPLRTKARAGSFCEANWKVTMPAGLKNAQLVMALADIFTGSDKRSQRYHYVDIVVNNKVVHHQDVASAKKQELIFFDISKHIAEQNGKLGISLRLYLRRKVHNFGVEVVASPIYLMQQSRKR